MLDKMTYSNYPEKYSEQSQRAHKRTSKGAGDAISPNDMDTT